MAFLGTLARSALDFALPISCAGCGEIVELQGFCLTCWQSLTLLGNTGCKFCSAPVGSADQLCGQCLADTPSHDGARAAIAYGEVARNVVVRFKYSRRIGLARVMVNQLEHLVPCEAGVILVPVPLHRWRLWQRGFNQSLLIARALAERTGHAVLTDLLVRKRATPPLAGMSPKERKKTTQGAFMVRDRALARDQNFVLVDDVYTTGATANACALALKRAGARSVRVLSWARALPDGQKAEY